MKKSKKVVLTYEETERLVTIAQEEKKPFELIKEEFGINENEVAELMRKKLSKDNFELWKKKIAKPKPKTSRFENLDDGDLNQKYYIKNKFD